MNNGLMQKTLMSLVVLALAAGLSSCGRKGALEAPPSAAIASDDAVNSESQSDVPDNPFLLDPLI